MNFFEPQKTLLHRGWLRLLPYTMLGAFLISLSSADSFGGILQNYFLLLGVECAIVVGYLMVWKKIKPKKQK
jgi:hypothetical protein